MPESKVNLKDLLDADLLRPETEVSCKRHTGRLRADGSIDFQGELFTSPSAFAKRVVGYASDGWRDVYANGRPLDTFRKQLVETGVNITDAIRSARLLPATDTAVATGSDSTPRLPNGPMVAGLRELLTAFDSPTRIRADLQSRLSSLSDVQFEHFVARFLERARGFTNVIVTKASGDRGVDVIGDRPGSPYARRVAIQVKRWTGGVGSREVQLFRGAIHGEFPEGIFVTLSKFSKDATDEAGKSGRVPVELIDGEALVTEMLAKMVGVQKREIQMMVKVDALGIDESVFRDLAE